jgi:hypothetical protein
MAWVEFHPSRIKRLQKFDSFRKDLSLSVNEALGTLGSFWGEVMDLSETGDITGWTPEYVAERCGLRLNPERVWNALVNNRWIDVRADGKVVVHDWLDCAGKFLGAKYASSNKELLKEIWAFHGRTYGKEKQPKPIEDATHIQRICEEPSYKEGKGREGEGKEEIKEDPPRIYESQKADTLFLVELHRLSGNTRLRWVAMERGLGIELPERVNDTWAAVSGLIATYGRKQTQEALATEAKAKGRKTVADCLRGAGDSLAKAQPEKAAQATKAAQTEPVTDWSHMVNE